MREIKFYLLSATDLLLGFSTVTAWPYLNQYKMFIGPRKPEEKENGQSRQKERFDCIVPR